MDGLSILSCVVLAGVSVLLHGCGGVSFEPETVTTTSGSGGTTTVTTTSDSGDTTMMTTTSSSGGTTTVTTTTTASPQGRILTSKQAADLLNKQYTGFDETDDTTPLGVTLSWAGQPTSFYKNIFCSAEHNPMGKTGCFNGQADCRMSTAIINHKVAINRTTGFLQPLMNRNTAYIFNQSLVESRWAKCSYLWDGATGNRLNGGCGDGSGELSCEKGKASAFENICESTGKTCTADDTEIKKAECKPYGPTVVPPKTHAGVAQCFFPEAAINYHGQNGWQPDESHMREMMKARVSFNSGRDFETWNIEKWDEVVLDEHLLLPDIVQDPNAAITAFAFVKGDNIAKENVKMMRDEYCKYNGCTTVPLVAINTNVDASTGPFEDENEPTACTPKDMDPWATGKMVQCCEGLTPVLDGGHYVCVEKPSSVVSV